MGARLWLDAVNTEWVEGDERVEGWPDAVGLGAWLRQAGDLYEEAGALRDFALADEALLRDMKRLRTTLRAVCEAAHATGALAPPMLEEINAALRHRGVVTRLEAGANGWRERELPSGEMTDAPYLLARSAARSLSRGELARLRPCANPNCILWFMDTSKNGTRRWCSMEGCGNRAKVAAHFARKRAK